MILLKDLANAAKRLKINQLLRLLFSDSDIQALVIELNTEKQLFEKGIDAKGKSLISIGGAYSFATVEIKRRKGQQTDWVTLKDTGDFYESFEVLPRRNEFVIAANTLKEGEDLQARWGDDLLGLTEESRKVLLFNLIPLLQNEIKKRLTH